MQDQETSSKPIQIADQNESLDSDEKTNTQKQVLNPESSQYSPNQFRTAEKKTNYPRHYSPSYISYSRAPIYSDLSYRRLSPSIIVDNDFYWKKKSIELQEDLDRLRLQLLSNKSLTYYDSLPTIYYQEIKKLEDSLFLSQRRVEELEVQNYSLKKNETLLGLLRSQNDEKNIEISHLKKNVNELKYLNSQQELSNLRNYSFFSFFLTFLDFCQVFRQVCQVFRHGLLGFQAQFARFLGIFCQVFIYWQSLFGKKPEFSANFSF